MNDKKETPKAVLHASLCAKIMVFRRITRIIGIVLNERTVNNCNKKEDDVQRSSSFCYICRELI